MHLSDFLRIKKMTENNKPLEVNRYFNLYIQQFDKLPFIWKYYYRPKLLGKTYTEFLIMDDFGTLVELDTSKTSFTNEH